jgi:rhodanese-related sulfurtransferase
VAEQYQKQGFNKVSALRGGVEAWKNAGYRVSA